MSKSNLAKIMKNKKLTVRKVAEKANISPVTVIKARNNIEDCMVSSLMKISKALNIDICDIFKKN